MSTNMLNLILLELRFRALRGIRDLPFYHGAQWNALFRNLLRPVLPPGGDLATSGIWVQPVETGIHSYDSGDEIRVDLTFPTECLEAVSRMLGFFNSLHTGEGHFRPGFTVMLESIRCRVSGKEHNPGDYARGVACTQQLTREDVEDEIDCLSLLDRFSILFHAPMRLKRPEGRKRAGHRYCDRDYFLSEGRRDVMGHLIRKIRLPNEYDPGLCRLGIQGGSLAWADVPYGVEDAKTLGGIIGLVAVCGDWTAEEAALLAIGQYAGSGKNPSFGFGFYTIPELTSVRKVLSLSRGNRKPSFSMNDSRQGLGSPVTF
jgi:hypothetical protein